MATILVTGGTGAIGSVLVRRLCEQGHRVRVLALTGDPFLSRVKGYACDIRLGTVTRPDEIAGACDGVETVYHLAAVIIAPDDVVYKTVNVEGTRNIVDEAKRAGARHFIHVSSASVVYPKPTPYSLSKRRAEEIVGASGLGYTIVRPTLVYGKGRGGQEFDLFLDYLRKFPVVPFIGSGRALKRPVFVEDLIDGLALLAGKREAQGKVYNFSGAEAISMLDLSRLCLALMGQEKKKIVRVPVWFCIVLARLFARTMKQPPLRWPVIAGVTQDANLDPSPAMQDLGYRPAGVSTRLAQCFPREK